MQQLLTRKSRWIAPGTIGRKNLHFDLSSFRGKLHTFGGGRDLFEHFWCKIPVEMFAEDEMHLTKESLWNFFNGDNPEVTKLTRNLCKEQFMHHIQIQIEIKKLHRWIYACCSKECSLACFSEMLELKVSSSALCISTVFFSHLINC